ncbi:hypothetical protein F1188_10915 [Roseospira marina]|uniref:Uncharacterized protein n=1 Tax=Roseospira marina TaxID=140057 RepID=A0A5M6IBS4_9PROT|nr:hypothetical protein [Roseospira marina]KAA5605407.1 hypothetical protein F1188_10915 [Roseospira marina]MBB4314602.1 hypothetical protein [Roseospira marina]MBB5088793.1 hypothetical protein [Roseospira marina]
MTALYPTVHLLARPDVTPSGLTIARTSPATRMTAFGRVERVPADTLRHDYDPHTGAYRGWLIEAARRNALLYSESLTHGLWIARAASVRVADVPAPDGLSAAFTLTETAGTAIHTLYQEDRSFTAGQTYALSVFARANGRERLQLVLPSTAFGAVQSAVFDLTTGTIGFVEGAAIPTLEALADGWYRCAITATAATTVTIAPVHLRLRDPGGSSTYAGDGTRGVLLWGVQLEAGSGATSYIATTSAPAARDADRMSLPLAGRAMNPNEGTMLVLGTVPAGQGATLATLHDGTSDTHLALTRAADGTAGGTLVTGGATRAALTQGGVDGGAEIRITAAYAPGDLTLAANGSVPVTDPGGAPPSGLTTLGLGGTATGPTGGRVWVRQVGLFPRRLTDIDLQVITA